MLGKTLLIKNRFILHMKQINVPRDTDEYYGCTCKNVGVIYILFILVRTYTCRIKIKLMFVKY